MSERHLKGIAAVTVALFVANWVPIVNLVRIIPTVKEILIGAGVVLAFTSATDWQEGVKFALLVGMIGAIIFTVINIPLSAVFGGVLSGAASETATNGAIFGGLVGAFGALSNIIGLVLFSPPGYVIGGAIGGEMN